jgi:hypothetical protein
MEIFFVGGDPICRNLVLGFGEIETAVAHHVAEAVFQGVFDAGVPGGGGIRVRPKIADII